MPTNIQIILIASASVFFLVIIYIFFKRFFTKNFPQNSIKDSPSLIFTDESKQGILSFNTENQPQLPQELITLNLISMDKSYFDINQVLTLLKNLDAKYTNGFFSYYDISGNEIFRIASGINPGLLDSETQTHILLLALDLFQVTDPIRALDDMIEVASNISDKLDACICDDQRAPLSKQMIEHLKSRAQDISRIKIMQNNVLA